LDKKQENTLDTVSYFSWVGAGMFGAMTATSVICDTFFYNQETIFTGFSVGLTCMTAGCAGIAATVANLKNA
jgi:hypothetical protein